MILVDKGVIPNTSQTKKLRVTHETINYEGGFVNIAYREDIYNAGDVLLTKGKYGAEKIEGSDYSAYINGDLSARKDIVISKLSSI